MPPTSTPTVTRPEALDHLIEAGQLVGGPIHLVELEDPLPGNPRFFAVLPTGHLDALASGARLAARIVARLVAQVDRLEADLATALRQRDDAREEAHTLKFLRS